MDGAPLHSAAAAMNNSYSAGSADASEQAREVPGPEECLAPAAAGTAEASELPEEQATVQQAKRQLEESVPRLREMVHSVTWGPRSTGEGATGALGGSSRQAGPGAASTPMAGPVASRRLIGRSKSMNVGALMTAEGLDKDEEPVGFSSGPQRPRGGPMASRKGFYSTAPSKNSKGGETGGAAAPPAGSSSVSTVSPSSTNTEKRGFYSRRGRSDGASPRERKIVFSNSHSTASRGPREEHSSEEGPEWVGNLSLDKWKASYDIALAGAASAEGHTMGSPGGDSSAGRTSSIGTPSPRGPLEAAAMTGANLPATPMGHLPNRTHGSMKKEPPGAQFPKPFMGGLFWNAKGAKVADMSPLGADAPPVLALEGPDRFSLLLLEEGEYYFKDYQCHFHLVGSEQRWSRVAGTLKVCSEALFFVPRNAHEPVFRIEYRNTEYIERGQLPVPSEEGGEAEEFFVVKASERTDVRIGNRHLPYRTHKGDFTFHFALVYTSLNAMLPRVQKLLDITKGPLEEKAKLLNQLIKRHEEELHFNAGWFEDEDETLLLEFVGSRITPLVSQPGRVVLTAWAVYFQPFNVVSSAPVIRYKLSKVTSVMRRSSVLEEVGVELFFSAWDSVYFMFKTPLDCNQFYNGLLKQPGLSLEKMKSLEQWQKEWVQGKVSNFDYLLYLNRKADRSFNDLSQYPVFPWVIADFTSPKLDLTKPETFRDLSKPIGALNPERLAGFKERYYELADAYEEWCEQFAPNPPPPHVPGTPSPPYLYGCHYSTPGYVVFFRLRDQPQLMLRLQSGRYDMPDRLLSSIPQLWESATSKSTDLKELIPEFYSLNPSFLINSEGLDFGSKQSGEKVGDVELPPWAEDADDFMRKMRDALESPYVSRKLHKWINLIFGYKQMGSASLEADNVFHPLTYDTIGAEILESIQDDDTRAAIRVQMREFGRTPKQLFSTLHPRQQRSEVRKMADFLRKCRRKLQLPLLLSSAPFDSTFVLHSIESVAKANARKGLLASKRSRQRTAPLQRRSSKYPTALVGALSPLAELSRPDRSVYRALQRVVGKDQAAQKFAVEWLELSAQQKDSGLLVIAHARHLAPLADLLRSRRAERKGVALRSVAALARAWPNRQLLLQAGVLEHVLLYIISGPYREATPAAVAALSRLSTEFEVAKKTGPEVVATLLSYLEKSNPPEKDKLFVEMQAFACEALGNLALDGDQRACVVAMGGIGRLLPLAEVAEHHTPELREMATRALACLAIGEAAQMQVVNGGGLRLALQMCEEDTGLVQEAALWLVASLAINENLRYEIASNGGLRLLCNASCAGDPELQEAAAAGLRRLCEDHTIVNSLVREEGLWSIIAMSQSLHNDVQRLAAGAFWHLAVHHENKYQIVAMGGLQSLLALASLKEKNMQATSLAQEALRKLADDDRVRIQLDGEDAALYRTQLLLQDVASSSSSSTFVSPLIGPHSQSDGEPLEGPQERVNRSLSDSQIEVQKHWPGRADRPVGGREGRSYEESSSAKRMIEAGEGGRLEAPPGGELREGERRVPKPEGFQRREIVMPSDSVSFSICLGRDCAPAGHSLSFRKDGRRPAEDR